MAQTPLETQKRIEAQARYDNINRRIEAIDRDISTETDGERLATLREKRAGLAQDRETVAGELSALGWEPQRTPATLEGRVGAVEETTRDHGGRLTAIERHIHPPWIVTFWRVMAALAIVAGLTAAAVWTEVLFRLYLPIGVIVEGAFMGLALVCILQANAQLERDK